LEGAKVYRQVWLPVTESELVMDDAQSNLFKIVQMNGKIASAYQQMLYQNRDTVLTYALYAYWVHRNWELSNSILKEYLFYCKEKGLTSNSSKIMLHISIERESIGTILNCSANLSGKLGFSKKQIFRNNLNTFVPPFYQEFHNA